MGVVYLITNNVNGKVYVGKTVHTLKERWRPHLYWAKRGFKGMVLYSAIRKYGNEAFSIKELGVANTPEELNALERLQIACHGSTDPRVGYNMTVGGDGGPLTPEARANLSRSVRAAMTTSVREKISAATKAVLTPEVRKKMSEAAKKQDPATRIGPWANKTFSEEHRNAISRGLTGKKHTAERRANTANARKTHCKNGHEFNDKNTYIAPSGARQCKACRFTKLKGWRESGRCLSAS